MINFFFYQIALFLNDLGFRVQGLGLRVLYLRLRVYVDCKILKGTLLNSKLEEQKEQLDNTEVKKTADDKHQNLWRHDSDSHILQLTSIDWSGFALHSGSLWPTLQCRLYTESLLNTSLLSLHSVCPQICQDSAGKHISWQLQLQCSTTWSLWGGKWNPWPWKMLSEWGKATWMRHG